MLRGLIALFCTQAAFSAFTIPISEYRGSLEQNSKGTWCWFPRYTSNDLSCRGGFASYNAVLAAHINQTTSIGYYNVNLELLGGPEWRIPASYVGVISICLSGRKGDGIFNTLCGRAYEDNKLPSEGCEVALGQTTVVDGCYDPSSSVRPSSASMPTSPSSSTSQAPGTFVLSHFIYVINHECYQGTNGGVKLPSLSLQLFSRLLLLGTTCDSLAAIFVEVLKV